MAKKGDMLYAWTNDAAIKAAQSPHSGNTRLSQKPLMQSLQSPRELTSTMQSRS
jgi:hypothetical protein